MPGNESRTKIVGLFISIVKEICKYYLRSPFRLLLLAVVLLVGFHTWTFICELNTRKITFLMGEHGSPSERDAKLIQTKIKETTGRWWPTFVTLESTAGYEENRERIDADTTGKVVGFAYDGFQKSQYVRTVLPLDKRYLHILCRKEFVEKMLRKSNAQKTQNGTDDGTAKRKKSLQNGVLFRDLVAAMRERDYQKSRPGRVFFGPKGSVTRQIAEIVLKHFKLDPGKLRCNGIGDFEEMRAAFSRKQIDVAFSSSQFGSEYVRQIAQDGGCVLVGLDGDRDAIIQDNPGMLPVSFQENSYVNGDFCPRKLQTIGARRVLICSREMRDKDAHFIGSMTAEALRHTIPEIEWENVPPEVKRRMSEPLTFQLHPGAELIRAKEEPSQWGEGVRAFLATLLVVVLTKFLQWLDARKKARKKAKKKRLDDKKPEQDETKPREDTGKAL